MGISLDSYRRNWPRVGAVLGITLGGATALAARRMTPPQVLAAANLIALLVHQYEEYQDPGYGAVQINVVQGSDQPRNYPVNADLAMWMNTAIAYPVYVAPILAPRNRVLGLGPVFFGFTQVALHGIGPRARAGQWYGPGFLSSFFLHLPIGIAYIRALNRERPTTRAEYAKGIGYGAAFFAAGLGAPSALFRDRKSPYGFTDAQMGPYLDRERRDEPS